MYSSASGHRPISGLAPGGARHFPSHVHNENLNTVHRAGSTDGVATGAGLQAVCSAWLGVPFLPAAVAMLQLLVFVKKVRLVPMPSPAKACTGEANAHALNVAVANTKRGTLSLSGHSHRWASDTA